MFNATNGNKKIADQVEEHTDEFASLFGAMSPRQQLALIAKMNEMVSDDESVKAFTSGTYAQDSTGRPAKALGTGTTTSADPVGDAWETIKNAGVYTPGMIAAVQRIVNTADPAHIKVDPIGTPVEIAAANVKVTDLTKERDAAITARDTAQRDLAAEQAKSAPAGTVKKADLKSEVEAIEKLITDEKLEDRHLVLVNLNTVKALVAKTKALVAKTK